MVKITNDIKEVIRNRIQRKHDERVQIILKDVAEKNKTTVTKVKDISKKIRESEREIQKMRDERDKIRNEFGTKYGGGEDGWRNGRFGMCDTGNVTMNYSCGEMPKEYKDKLFDVQEQYQLAVEEIQLSDDKDGVLKRVLDRISKL